MGRARDGFRPGLGWRMLRWSTQLLALVAILVSPLLGGWQRLERTDLSSWASPGSDLPAGLHDNLPRGETAAAAHEQNRLLGGGVGVEYFGVPTIDPLAGVFMLMARPSTARAILALAIPVLIALFVGRVFCGWFCPFGTMSRSLAWLLDLVPARAPIRLPKRRPLRFFVLVVGLLGGLFGAHVVLYLALPHLLVQQSVYGLWLLGGGGAALGLLVGLLLVGLLLGPTTYCATVCPTGAALRILGSKKVVHLKIAEPRDCGASCRRCAQTCWLQLDPASGAPGPDCDLCARCVTQCPKTNLRIGLGKGKLARTGRAATSSLLLVAIALVPTGTRAQGGVDLQPRLSLAAERVVDGVTIAIDVVDQTGVRPYPDADETLHGSDVSVFIARGQRGPADERGLLPSREVYEGRLQITIEHGEGTEVLTFDEPTAPRSAPRRTIYSDQVELRLEAGDTIEVAPIEGWLPEAERFVVPAGGARVSVGQTLLFVLLGALLFGGMLAIAVAIGSTDEAPIPRERKIPRKMPPG